MHHPTSRFCGYKATIRGSKLRNLPLNPCYHYPERGREKMEDLTTLLAFRGTDTLNIKLEQTSPL